MTPDDSSHVVQHIPKHWVTTTWVTRMRRSCQIFLIFLAAFSNRNDEAVLGFRIAPQHETWRVRPVSRHVQRSDYTTHGRVAYTSGRTRTPLLASSKTFILRVAIARSVGLFERLLTVHGDSPSTSWGVAIQGCLRPSMRRRCSVGVLRAEEEQWIEALKEMSGNSGLPMGPRKVL